MIFLLSAIAISLASSSPAFRQNDWELCRTDIAHVLSIKSLESSNPKVGGKVTLTASGIVSRKITSVSIKATAKLGVIPVKTVTIDLCSLISCPIENEVQFDHTLSLEKAFPGTFTLQVERPLTIRPS